MVVSGVGYSLDIIAWYILGHNLLNITAMLLTQLKTITNTDFEFVCLSDGAVWPDWITKNNCRLVMLKD